MTFRLAAMTFGRVAARREFRQRRRVPELLHRQSSRLLLVTLFALVGTYVGMVFLSPQFAPASRQAFALYGLVAVYCVLAVWGDEWLHRRWGTRGVALYFALQCAVFAALREVGPPNAYPWMLSMPVISQAAACLRWPGVTLVVLFFAGHIAWIAWMFSSRWQTAVLNHVGILAAYTFTIAFTRSARAASEARDHAARLAAELESANARLRAHAAQSAEVAALHERNRIARDIHDGLGHFLTVVAVQLQAARALVGVDAARAAVALGRAEEASRAALDDVRRSVGTLRSSSGPGRPLPARLEELIRESGLEVTLRTDGKPRELPEATAEVLFRAAQEGLTNVRKHSGGTCAELVLDFRAAQRVALEIADSGRGSAVAPEAGFGLVGLRERCAALGGGVVAGNRTGGGFSLRAEVPA